MDITLNVIQRLDREFIFQGLSIQSIEYLRDNGLWMPVTKEILSIDSRLTKDACQLYLEHTDLNLLTIVVEYGEFLTGSVYDVIDLDAEPDITTFLHQYGLENGALAKEHVQLIEKGIVFLNLLDSEGKVLGEWDDEGIEYVLKTQIN